MRLSEFQGTSVTDREGRHVGQVADVVGELRIADDPEESDLLEVVGLVVVERRRVGLLGYERDINPLVFRWLVRRVVGGVWWVPWGDVVAAGPDGVRLATGSDDLTEHRRRW